MPNDLRTSIRQRMPSAAVVPMGPRSETDKAFLCEILERIRDTLERDDGKKKPRSAGFFPQIPAARGLNESGAARRRLSGFFEGLVALRRVSHDSGPTCRSQGEKPFLI